MTLHTLPAGKPSFTGLRPRPAKYHRTCRAGSATAVPAAPCRLPLLPAVADGADAACAEAFPRRPAASATFHTLSRRAALLSLLPRRSLELWAVDDRDDGAGKRYRDGAALPLAPSSTTTVPSNGLRLRPSQWNGKTSEVLENLHRQGDSSRGSALPESPTSILEELHPVAALPGATEAAFCLVTPAPWAEEDGDDATCPAGPAGGRGLLWGDAADSPLPGRLLLPTLLDHDDEPDV